VPSAASGASSHESLATRIPLVRTARSRAASSIAPTRDVFTKMHEHYPELECVNDHQNRDLEKYFAVLDCMIDPESKRYLSEDYAFCRRWQQMGGKIYADCMTVLGHVGNIRFIGNLEERLKAQVSV
jgi:hypothetical protein